MGPYILKVSFLSSKFSKRLLGHLVKFSSEATGAQEFSKEFIMNLFFIVITHPSALLHAEGLEVAACEVFVYLDAASTCFYSLTTFQSSLQILTIPDTDNIVCAAMVPLW